MILIHVSVRGKRRKHAMYCFTTDRSSVYCLLRDNIMYIVVTFNLLQDLILFLIFTWAHFILYPMRVKWRKHAIHGAVWEVLKYVSKGVVKRRQKLNSEVRNINGITKTGRAWQWVTKVTKGRPTKLSRATKFTTSGVKVRGWWDGEKRAEKFNHGARGMKYIA